MVFTEQLIHVPFAFLNFLLFLNQFAGFFDTSEALAPWGDCVFFFDRDGAEEVDFFFGAGWWGAAFRVLLLIYYLNLLVEMTASMRIITSGLFVAARSEPGQEIGLRQGFGEVPVM